MKALDSEKLEKRRKSSRYQFGFRYYGISNKMEIVSTRNERVFTENSMTDEDVILLSQLVDSISEEFHKMLVERDLLPEELKKVMCDNGRDEQKEEVN